MGACTNVRRATGFVEVIALGAPLADVGSIDRASSAFHWEAVGTPAHILDTAATNQVVALITVRTKCRMVAWACSTLGWCSIRAGACIHNTFAPMQMEPRLTGGAKVCLLLVARCTCLCCPVRALALISYTISRTLVESRITSRADFISIGTALRTAGAGGSFSMSTRACICFASVSHAMVPSIAALADMGAMSAACGASRFGSIFAGAHIGDTSLALVMKADIAS